MLPSFPPKPQRRQRGWHGCATRTRTRARTTTTTAPHADPATTSSTCGSLHTTVLRGYMAFEERLLYKQSTLKGAGMPTYKVRYAHIRALVRGVHAVAGRRVRARHSAPATPRRSITCNRMRRVVASSREHEHEPTAPPRRDTHQPTAGATRCLRGGGRGGRTDFSTGALDHGF
jgi:hypothetical protein